MTRIELKAIMAAILVHSIKGDYINQNTVITAVHLANMILEEVTKDENDETLAEYKRFKESQLPPRAKSPMPTDK